MPIHNITYDDVQALRQHSADPGDLFYENKESYEDDDMVNDIFDRNAAQGSTILYADETQDVTALVKTKLGL